MEWEVLCAQDDQTSNAVLKFFEGDSKFTALSKQEGEDIIKRDAEDDEKLAKGIALSVSRGVLPGHVDVETTVEIDVKGKSADEVADEILSRLSGTEGQVLVLQGLSGTGKGTTVAKLQSKLAKCVCWSNGNVFRSVTYLASRECELTSTEFGPAVLSTEKIAGYMKNLVFKKFDDGSFDIEINADSGMLRVSEICNTILKAPPVGSRVPTVAEMCQGEVVLFAAEAVRMLMEAGFNVILEGRSQTLDHIRTPHRFTLVIKEPQLLGQRRAAQRIMAAAVSKLTGQGSPSVDQIAAVLRSTCDEMA